MTKRLFNKYGQYTKFMKKLDPKLRKLSDKYFADVMKLFTYDVDFSDARLYFSYFATLSTMFTALRIQTSKMKRAKKAKKKDK